MGQSDQHDAPDLSSPMGIARSSPVQVALLACELNARYAWEQGREALTDAGLQTWGDLIALVSSLTTYCHRIAQCYAEALHLTAQWYGRRLSRIAVDRQLRPGYACSTALLEELQAFRCHEPPPTLALSDDRARFWERVVVWLERERAYLERRWFAAAVSFAPTEPARH